MYNFYLKDGQEVQIVEDYSLKKGAPFSLKVSKVDTSNVSTKEIFGDETLSGILQHLLGTETFLVLDGNTSKQPHIRLFDADMCTAGDVKYFFGKKAQLSCYSC